MRILIFLSYFLLLTNIITAQQMASLDWAQRIGGTGNDASQDIYLDAAGNIYTTGSFSGTVDFDPGIGVFNMTAAGTADIFISKLDANGNFIWAKKMGGNGTEGGAGVTADLAGNVYVTGGFQGTSDFDPGPGTFTMTSAGQTDIFIAKLDVDGNFVWAKGIIGGTWWDHGLKIMLDAAANVHVVGRFYFQGGPRDFDPGPGTFFLAAGQEDAFILKLDTNGDFIWAKHFGGGSTENRGYSIVLDAAGNIYTTGYFEGTIDFDPGAGTYNLTASGDWDIYYSKLDPNGNFVWARAMVNSHPTYYTEGTNGSKISLDGAGNVYVTSRFNGTIDFDPGAGVFNLTSQGSFDIYITKLTTDGDFVWAKSIGGSGYDEGMAIANDAAGNVYVTGYYAQTVDFDSGAGVFNLTSAGSNDAFICKLDTDGNFQWAGSMGGTGDDRGIALKSDATSNIYLTGWFQGTADFDPRPCTYNLTSAGSNDIFIQKLSQTAVLPPPTITSFTPSSGPSGTTVTITGTNFSTIPTNNIVKFFNNITATVTSSTSTSLEVIVPNGATTGKISVEVNCVAVQSITDFMVTAPVLPAITSFTPSAGAIGTTVTINGTNFNTITASNIVYFGATKALVSAATATQLTVTVPPGATYASITVLNTATSLLAYSRASFTPTFTPNKGSITTCDFDPKVDFTTNPNAYSVVVGDLDGDGKADLAVANYGSNSVSVFRNTSSNGLVNYDAKVDFTTGANPFSVAAGDLDGDGKLDLAVVNNSSNTVSVFRNTGTSGTISYAAKIDFATGSSPWSVAISDLDGDGKSDLAVASYSSNRVSVFRNTGSIGNISYAPRVDFTTGTFPISVATGDVDGDGKTDLAVANYNSNTVSIFRNTSTIGSINYAAKVDFSTSSNPYALATGDLDGDGKSDLAVLNYFSTSTSVFRNTSSVGIISYASKVDFTTGGRPSSVAIGDLDGDGKGDLSVVNYTSNTVSVLRNTSSISTINFDNKVDFVTGSGPYSVAIGDADGDTKPDIIVANEGSNTISVFRNNPSITLPTITGLTPSSGYIGATVTITGTNLSTIAANNIVKFNGTPAVVISSTATSITTTVPTGATTGKITVTIGCNTATSVADFTVGTVANEPPVILSAISAAPINGIVTIDLLPLISDPDDNLDLSTLSLVGSTTLEGASAMLVGVTQLELNYGNVVFAGTDRISISVCDLLNSCTEQELSIEVSGEIEIFNAVSPNNDNKNEIFRIGNIDLLEPNNKVTIYNRWGSKVFEVSNYNNTDHVFKGLNDNGNELPSGTYFYRIVFTRTNLGNSEKERTGYLILKR